MFEASDVLVPFHKRKYTGASEETKTASSALSEYDMPSHGAEDENKGAIVYQRYCHVYHEGELGELARALHWCQVENEYYDCGNWCVEVRKVKEMSS